MTSIVVVGEDDLSCTLGASLVRQVLPDWSMPFDPINTRGVTKLCAALPRYHNQLAQLHHVLCVADTDGHCPVDIRALWLPHQVNPRFLLRLAVTESESWALADRPNFAHAFGVSVATVARDPEALPDVKREVLRLAARSSRRLIREEVPGDDPSKPGPGYNLHLCRFAAQGWSAVAARHHSRSLDRAITALETLRDAA